jgi:8-oxo-dGTP pyrophosphatase MutT (NUDIX family)
MDTEFEQRIYEIYINERPLYIIHKTALPEVKEGLPENHLIFYYRPRIQTLLNCIDHLEKGAKSAIVLYNSTPKETYQSFKTLFKKVVACGGLVQTQVDDTILMIFRRKTWDLPKGKMEKMEKKRQTAMREVEEETGISGLIIDDKIITTQHVFRDKTDQRVLKINHWYWMTVQNKSKPKPQAEEDIDKAVWVSMDDALKKKPIFKSIKKVLLAFKELSGDN